MSNIRFIELAQSSLPNTEQNVSGEWIEYGNNNKYMDYLTDRYIGSPTNHAIINGISDLIVGNGLTAKNAHRNPVSYAEMKRLLRDDDIKVAAFNLKTYGFAVLEIILDQTRTKIAEVNCTSSPYWRKGTEDNWYFSKNWEDIHKNKPVPVPLFDHDSKESRQVYIINDAKILKEYPPVDYHGGLTYIELEEEIGSFHLSAVNNGLFPGMLINFNNGIPDSEKQDEMERKIKNKWGGSKNAGKFIMSFNENKEAAPTIEAVQQPDQDKLYEFLSRESTQKIMLSHRVVSPMLFGIKDNTGLGNNAEELKDGFLLFENMVIKPKRNVLTRAFEDILAKNNVALELTFETLKPIEFDKVKLSAHDHDFTEIDEESWLSYLDDKGEFMDDYILISEEAVTHDNAERFEKEDTEIQLSANEKSEQDIALIKIRYAYAPENVSGNSRKFCKSMVGKSKQGVVYRKEDIIKMGNDGVNSQFAAKGESTYSIWLYKGGVNCHHYWMRRIYMRKRGANGQFLPPSKTDQLENERPISVNEARKQGTPIPVNPTEVAQIAGPSNNYWRKK